MVAYPIAHTPGTDGKQVADVFYVKDVFGMKIQHDNKLQQIRQALLDAAGS